MSTENHFGRIPHSQTERVFVNRNAELKSLCDAFDKASLTYTKRFITGLGGVGKTSLVKQYVENLKKDSKDFFCLYLQGHEIQKLKQDSENFVQINFGFRETSQEITENAFRWASFFAPYIDQFRVSNEVPKGSTILIVITKVVKQTYLYAQALSDKLSKQNPVLLLITSDTSPPFGHKTEHIRLKGLEDIYSKELLRRSSLGSFSENDLDEICKELSNIPIALQHAISYITRMQMNGHEYTISDYVKASKDPRDAYHLLASHLPGESEPSNSIVKSVDLLVQNLQSEGSCGKLAIAMIQILAWIDDGSIDEEEFIQITGSGELVPFNTGSVKRKEHQDAILLLEDYTLIERFDDNVNLAYYSVMHRVIRTLFESSKTEVLNVLVKNYGKIQTYLKSAVFVEEVQNSLKRHRKNVQNLKKTCDVNDESLHKAEMLFVKYLHICRPLEAIELLQAKLEKCEEIHPVDTSRKLEILLHLGTLYKLTKRYGEEIVLREKLNQYLEYEQDEGRMLKNLLQLSLAFLELEHIEKASTYWKIIADNEEPSNKKVNLEAKNLLNKYGYCID